MPNVCTSICHIFLRVCNDHPYSVASRVHQHWGQTICLGTLGMNNIQTTTIQGALVHE